MAIRKLLLSLGLMVVVLAAGLFISGWLHRTRPPAQRAAEAAPPPLVDVIRVTREDLPERFVGYGSARADRDVIVAAEVAGVIVEMAPHLNDGVEVQAGALLVRIDDRQYQQQLARAAAAADELTAQIDQLDVERDNVQRLAVIAEQEREVNRDELDRLAELFERNQASKKEYDFARLAYDQSRRQVQVYKNDLALIAPRTASLEALRRAREADAALARLDIERCRVLAPFDGQVDQVRVNVGDRVMPGSEVVRLMSTRHIEVPLELPASVRARVSIGADCRLEADSLPGVAWQGRVSRIAPAADIRSRTVAVYVDVDNAEQAIPLVPGYFLKATVDGPVLRQVVAIPRGVIVDRSVFVANGTQAHTRPVRVERYVGERAVVTGDLEAGDLLIVTNLDVLSDGATVRVSGGRVAGDDDSIRREEPVITGSDS